MLIQTGKGDYFAHFTHERRMASTYPYFSRSKDWSWRTICTIHAGPCARKSRPCMTDNSHVGIALCSVHDNFSRRVGHKLAFTRAIRGYPREVRARLWDVYLRVNPAISTDATGETKDGQTVAVSTPSAQAVDANPNVSRTGV